MSGGNDFIAKPFLFIELAVKALVYVLRGRLPADEVSCERQRNSTTATGGFDIPGFPY